MPFSLGAGGKREVTNMTNVRTSRPEGSEDWANHEVEVRRNAESWVRITQAGSEWLSSNSTEKHLEILMYTWLNMS